MRCTKRTVKPDSRKMSCCRISCFPWLINHFCAVEVQGQCLGYFQNPVIGLNIQIVSMARVADNRCPFWSSGYSISPCNRVRRNTVTNSAVILYRYDNLFLVGSRHLVGGRASVAGGGVGIHYGLIRITRICRALCYPAAGKVQETGIDRGCVIE